MAVVGTLRFAGSIALDLAEPQTGKIMVATRFGGITVITQGDHMAYQLPNDMLINVQVAYVDAGGNAAKVDGDVAWQTSDNSIIRVEVDAQDSTMCRIVAQHKNGKAQVSATADADLGDGVKALVTTFDIDAIAGEAVAGTITPLGDPEPIAAHVEPV
jgi:hypothetical protein